MTPFPHKMTQILELESKGVEAPILNIRRHKMKICFQERGMGFQKRNCNIKKCIPKIPRVEFRFKAPSFSASLSQHPCLGSVETAAYSSKNFSQTLGSQVGTEQAKEREQRRYSVPVLPSDSTHDFKLFLDFIEFIQTNKPQGWQLRIILLH